MRLAQGGNQHRIGPGLSGSAGHDLRGAAALRQMDRDDERGGLFVARQQSLAFSQARLGKARGGGGGTVKASARIVGMRGNA